MDKVMSDRTTGRMRRSRALHQSEIVEAAAIAFMKQGFASTSVDDIADALGCTKGRIYYYFKNKTELFFAVHEETIRTNLRNVWPIAQMELAPAAKLERMVRAHIQHILDRLPYQRVSLEGLEKQKSARTTPQERELLDRIIRLYHDYEELFREVAKQGMEQGVFETGDVNVIVKSLFGTMNWMVMWYRPDAGRKTESDNIIIDGMSNFIMNGIIGRR